MRWPFFEIEATGLSDLTSVGLIRDHTDSVIKVAIIHCCRGPYGKEFYTFRSIRNCPGSPRELEFVAQAVNTPSLTLLGRRLQAEFNSAIVTI